MHPVPRERTPAAAERVIRALIAVAVAVVLGSLLLITRADADLWGHLRFGLDMLDTREIPTVDPYSFTQDTAWINHEWLSEVQMAASYRAGGLTGLLILKAALLACPFAMVWIAYRHARLAARVAVGVMLVVGTLHMTAVARPQLWTFSCLAVLVTLLASDRPERRWLVPPLMAFWANCHGGWIVGLGVLVAWAAVDTWGHHPRTGYWARIVGASAAATLLNPYGFGLWGFLADTVRTTRPIDEWLPLWTAPALNWVPWGAGVVAVGWLAWRRQIHGPAVAVLAVLAYGAFRVQRIESLFVLAAALLLAPAVATRWPARSWRRAGAGSTAAVAAALVVAVAASSVVARRAISCVPISGAWAPDVEVAGALKQGNPAGRLVNPFNWGEYAIWHFGPALKVSIDGRRETVYSDRHLRQHDGVVAGTVEGLATLAAWRPDYVWLPAASTTTRQWLETRGYRVDVESPRSFVAVRSDLPALLPVSAAGAGHCFPGPPRL